MTTFETPNNGEGEEEAVPESSIEDAEVVAVAEVDIDGDGQADAVVAAIDVDGDGVPDAAVVAIDVDGDGEVDVMAIVEVDESGEPDLANAELIDVVETRKAKSPFDREGRWYVVHTYAGYENKVKSNLASRVRSMAVEDRIFEVVIPMEDVIEFKNGRKVVVQKKVFPGYLLVRMDLDDHAWYVVRNTPGVTGFVGSGAKPTPLSRKEVENILGTGEIEEGVAAGEKKVRPRLEYEVAEQVRVVTGPFADFNGVISEIDVDRSKLKVLVNIFGRETPVELEFSDVAKL
ncbi:MAG TPA: transcription termination/antitermination protein NusG [Acidimicrobiia bacterium]|nr:transcription termination/antitermination protein NusG [Acidimicrobiia bacterium]